MTFILPIFLILTINLCFRLPQGTGTRDRALLSSAENYNHLSIRRVDIYKDPVNQKNLQWSVFYIVIREETGY